jgi:hypothetical protein
MKTMKTRQTLLIWTMAVGLFSGIMTSCNPDDEPQYLGEFRLGAEGEAYIKFEPGSYWVYENDQTGERDSIVMQWYNSQMLHFEGRTRDYYREHIQFQWRGNSGTYDFITSHLFVDLTPQEQFNKSIRRWNLATHKVTGTSTMIYFPLDYNVGGSVSGQRVELKRYDSLQVKGQWYFDVAEFEVSNDWIWDSKPTKYFWAKHVGLIKREKYAHWTNEYTEGWHLIRYQVTP